MLKAKDFRAYGREALRGRWLKAGAAGLVAGLLGASISVGNYVTSYTGSISSGSDSATADLATVSQIPASFFAAILGVLLVGLVWALVVFVIGGAMTLGYAKYNLNLVDDTNPRFKDIFSQFHRLGTGFGMQFFRGLFTFLWSLLFVIPGIIASYRYYMTPFILLEHPEMTAREAITESKELMKGNKWRLFCLEFSFIGWELLAAIIMVVVMTATIFPLMASNVGGDWDALFNFLMGTLLVIVIDGIVFIVLIELTLSPYITASVTAFYREIKDAKYSNPQVEGYASEFAYESPAEDEGFASQPTQDDWENREL